MGFIEGGQRLQRVQVSGIDLEWEPDRGVCTFQGLPVALMWIDTTLCGLMHAVQTMVGTPRFLLALQSGGRGSVEADWDVISRFPDFRDGIAAIANIAAVAGWGRWELSSFDPERRECRFRGTDTWESGYQRSLGVSWGSALLAGKLSGYCSKLFGVNCWAEQTAFIAKGDEYDEFVVRPSSRLVETELENLLATDAATQADMAVALTRLRNEIAEHRRTEAALVKANQQLELLAANIHEAVLAFDMDRRLIFANPAVERLTGYSAEDIKREHFICWIHPDDQERMLGYWDRLFQGESYAEAEYQLVTKQGVRKWVAASWGPLLDESGRQVGVQGSERDITKRKRAEAGRALLEEQLRHAQKLESIGRLAGGIAHDFNNLLTVINGYSESILEELGPDHPLRGKLALIHESGERAAGLTSQLLTFSRKQVTEPRPVSLHRVITESWEMLGRLVGKDVLMVTDLAPEDCPVMADPRQLHQVLMNLVVNARDAMPAGGRLRIETRTVALDAAAASGLEVSPGAYVVLSVSDTGTGMSKEVQRKVFEPFFTTKDESIGTGLGLSTVYGIVRQAGGWIRVESEVGSGATFRIGLPRLAAPGTNS